MPHEPVTATIEDRNEIEITVFGEYSPADKGSRDAYGQPMEPDYPSSVRFLRAEDEAGNEIELDKEEMDRAQNALTNALDDYERGLGE